MAVNVKFVGSIGGTRPSLKALRDELAQRFDHEITVVEVQHPDNVTCGFAIFDFTGGELVLVANGFRYDQGGEGGAGYRAAIALNALFVGSSIPVFEGISMRTYNEWFERRRVMLELIEDSLDRELFERFLSGDFEYCRKVLCPTKPRDFAPWYVDWVFRR